jgi:hypothetical protein
MLHVLGLDSGNSAWYLFYSGIFTVITVAASQLLRGYQEARHHNCHEPRCWRIGRFPVEGTSWTACKQHHPEPPSKGDIRTKYHLYIGDKPGRG